MVTPSTSAPAVPLLEQAEQGTSLWMDAWLRLRKNKMAVLGAVIILVISFASVFGPLMVAFSYEETNLRSEEHTSELQSR